MPQSEPDWDGNHNLYTFGRGFCGELGLGTYTSADAPRHLHLGFQEAADFPGQEEEITAAVVTCGRSHSAAITRRGTLYTWGLGAHGELGAMQLGHVGENVLPQRVSVLEKPQMRIVSIAVSLHLPAPSRLLPDMLECCV